MTSSGFKQGLTFSYVAGFQSKQMYTQSGMIQLVIWEIPLSNSKKSALRYRLQFPSLYFFVYFFNFSK